MDEIYSTKIVDIDTSANTSYTEFNITATLSALWVTRNLGGFSLPFI